MSPSTPNTEIALLKQAMDFQNKEISEIKKILLDFIDSAPNKFATKEEHEANINSTNDKIKEIKEAHNKIAWAAISFIWVIIIGFASFVLEKLWIL